MTTENQAPEGAPALTDEQIDEITNRHYRTRHHPDSYAALRETIKDAIAADRAALAAQPQHGWLVEEQPDGTVTPVDPADMPKGAADHLELFKEAGEWAETMRRQITPDMIELLGWLTSAANLWAEKIEARQSATQAPAEAHKVPGFSPMHFAPLDGTPVMLYMPTTGDKFAVGRWYGSPDSLHGNWGDDEGDYYVHEPVCFMALSNLERLVQPSFKPQHKE